MDLSRSVSNTPTLLIEWNTKSNTPKTNWVYSKKSAEIPTVLRIFSIFKILDVLNKHLENVYPPVCACGIKFSLSLM